MHTQADKTQENKSQSVANLNAQKQTGGESTFQFVVNRPEAIAQRKLQEMANNSPQVKLATQLQAMANNSPQAKQAAQLQSMADNHSAQQQQPFHKKENNTGLPDNLKIGMENLSGMPLEDVKVHRNSDKPAQLQAHGYAQGTDIHLASGQEKHLPHKAWHVVQQKQRRVKPTMQMKGDVNIDDDHGLEKEADVMGAKALQPKVDGESVSLVNKSTPFYSREDAIQLKTLTDAKLDQKPIESTTDYRTTVGERRLPGKIYNLNVFDKKGEGRGEALTIAAEKNGDIGEAVDKWGIANVKPELAKKKEKWAPGKIFTKDEKLLESNQVPTLDPFFLFTTVKFDTDEDTHFLHLIFQHTSDYSGYLEAISDTSNPQTESFPSMFMGRRDKEQAKKEDRDPKFRNEHDQEKEGSLLSMTGGGGEANFDAYSKIAGEGARWECVRIHSAYLENASFFYTTQGADKATKQVLAVRFSDLWVSWKTAFEKKYNIKDEKVREAIESGKGIRVESLPYYEMGAEDYNLDVGPNKQDEPHEYLKEEGL